MSQFAMQQKSGPTLSNADDLQNQASDPQQSVWVAASAGSGKTKVLTDRVLRLLLPGLNGEPGTPPERILCLTFTKAGAAEMGLRITHALSRWAVEDDALLHKNLSQLLGRAPKPAEIEAARRLFARVIDAEGGLKILTIHSFCQSILGRFPIEAGLPPHFHLIDERGAAEIQKRALEKVIRTRDTHLKDSLIRLSLEKDEGDIIHLLQGVMRERQKLAAAQHQNSDALYQMLGIQPGDTEESLLEGGFAAFDQETWHRICETLASSEKSSMQDKAVLIGHFLAAPWPLRERYAQYRQAFLIKDGAIQKRMTTQDIASDINDFMNAEAARLERLEDRMRTAHCALLSVDLLRVASAVFIEYQREKAEMAVLDYDDLIACTLDLLSGKSMGMAQEDVTPWVMFKLDQGIDHILVDEAQDTNPDQWEIIHALAGEFFAGVGSRDDINRTVFAVGDEKQSIFGFQRAAPEKFRQAEMRYAAKAAEANKPFQSIPMTLSFRSSEPILALTDAIFDTPESWQALGLQEGTIVQHSSHRHGQAGRVELWPLIDPPDAPEIEPWSPPINVEENDNAEAVLAARIAETIKGWIGNDILEAYDRSIHAGDILILVRSRGTMVDHLVRALKSANVDVSGVDRMKLAEQISVQDLLAAAQFALLPEDDLTLACLLKSPLIGLSEQGLYEVAIDRTGSLWASAKSHLTEEIVQWLSVLIAKAGTSHPYEFFSDLLHLPCPAGSSGLKAMVSRLGEDSVDPMEEFLNTTLDYEVDHTPSLQQFVAWQEAGNTEIKREMEGAGNKVRIMTVHGSKGLQAPIVILPDTVHNTASIGKIGLTERIVWTNQGPLWSPRAGEDCRIYKDLLTEKKARLTEEYKRLLYVALTRAADRLYIAGCVKGKKSKPAPDCWYHLVEQGFKKLADRVGNLDLDKGDAGPALFMRSEQIAAPDKKARQAEQVAVQPACDDWSWMMRDPPEEETPPRPFMPSRPSDPEPAAVSPLGGDQGHSRFRRGNITHTLLQFLPSLPEEGWKNAAERFVQKQRDIAPDIQAGIVDEVMKILTHPDFHAIFGPGSKAEVPLTALLDNKLISGQIDRLLVTDREIMIVDYKTNRPPPQHERDVPAIYRTQLRAYRDVLAKIYPGRPIRTFLLWTDGPRMMDVKL